MPYAVRLRGAEPLVFWDDGSTRKSHFGIKEAAALTDLMLTRKMRGNGVGRQLMSRLVAVGNCSAYFQTQKHERYGFAWTREEGAYILRLVGDYPQPLLHAINRAFETRHAFVAHQFRKERQRLERRSTSHLRYRNTARAIVGDNGALHQHFRNTSLTWSGTLTLISRAVRLRPQEVETRLLTTMLERGVAVLRIRTTFVIRVSLGAAFTGSVPSAHPVTLWSTKDNTHPVYRRLRKALRQLRVCRRPADCVTRKRRVRRTQGALHLTAA